MPAQQLEDAFSTERLQAVVKNKGLLEGVDG